MNRRRERRTIEIVLYILTAIVALSMIVSLVGPVVIETPSRSTPTWPPTWTPMPTATRIPTREATQTSPPLPTPSSTATVTPAPSPTWTTVPTATQEPTPTSTPQPVSRLVFAVCGDSRGNPQLFEQILDQIVEQGNAFVVHTGDMVNVGTQANWLAVRQLMADFPLPFYPAAGNHDADRDGSLRTFLQYSGAPAPEYSFDAGPVHMAIANSSSGHLREKELAWLDEDLSATDQPLKMVVVHHPPFDPDGTDHILSSGNQEFMSLMQEHHVAYVFAGHVHAYGQAERNGTTFVVTGGAGAPLYTQGHPNAFHHYVQVTVEGTEVSTEVKQVS